MIGIREATDEREAAGHSIFTLIDGLENDLLAVERTPDNLKAKLSGLAQGILDDNSSMEGADLLVWFEPERIQPEPR